MGRDRHMHDVSSLVCQDDQYEEESIRGGWHDEEIGSPDLADMIREKRAPRLGGRPSVPGHVFRNSRLADVNSKLQEFAVNARSTPQRVGPSPSCESIRGRPAEPSVDQDSPPSIGRAARLSHVR